MGELRSDPYREIHSSRNAVPIHRLNDMRMKGSAHCRKVKTLIAIAHSDLVFRIENPVIPNLSGYFTAADKADVVIRARGRKKASVKVFDPVTPGQSHGRLWRQFLHHIR